MARRGDPRPPRGPEVLGNPFTEIPGYPDGSIFDDPKEAFMGHPTAPGPYEETVPRHGLPSPGNGSPGIPLARVGRGRGPGIPGTTPTGPMQPGAGIQEEEF